MKSPNTVQGSISDQQYREEKYLIVNRKMNRWTKLQILFQFHPIHYKSGNFLSATAFTNADMNASEQSPQKGVLWAN